MRLLHRLTTPTDWSIRWKLMAMAMSATALTLLLTVAGITAYEYHSLRKNMGGELGMIADVVGGNTTAAIEFRRPDDVSSTLETLSAKRDIRAACVYDAEGKLLAKYTGRGEVNTSFEEHPGPAGVRWQTDTAEIYRPIMLDGKMIGTVYLRSDLTELGMRLRTFLEFSPIVMLAACMGGFLLISRLQRWVSVPIASLAETSRRITEANDYTLRAKRYGADEIGQLADVFNMMLEGIRARDGEIQKHLAEVQTARDELEQRVELRTQDLKRTNSELQDEIVKRQELEAKRTQMQADLVEASRKAGMADVATGVLHNVGNVLNSINVSTQVVHDAVKASRVTALQKAADLLREHERDLAGFLTADSRGKALPGYLMKLAGALQEEHASLLKEFDGLAMNIGHIREIVSMQQSLARVSGVVSQVTIGEMIEDALKINQAGLKRHQVAIDRDFEPGMQVTTDRHKMLQILINLISNAKYAVDDTPQEERRIAIKVREEDGQISVAIKDNGVGIAREHLTKIFAYGFTTKKNGHGFGLHASALAAKELGGSISVMSDGLGKGATFVVTVPVRKEASVHA